MGKIVTDNEELINLIEETPSLKQIVDKAEGDLSEADVKSVTRALLDICNYVSLGVDEEMNLAYIKTLLYVDNKIKRFSLDGRHPWNTELAKSSPLMGFFVRILPPDISANDFLSFLERLLAVYTNYEDSDYDGTAKRQTKIGIRLLDKYIRQMQEA